ncbi:MAG: hypothetical protein AUJ60_08465 [Nitrospirae bacterium CG1_02_44_142]|nr:MAG: hypothetical protein AUJ60_08465 [Nitrospirae bacterium CG1_02_44_142]
MELTIEGNIYKVGVTKDKKREILGILVKRADGQADSLTIFTDRLGHKPNTVFKGKVSAYFDMCNEVAF